MGFDQNVEMIRLAFYQVLISSGPFLGAALAIGLVIGIIQAATSIQEMTLSFVPKIVIVIFGSGIGHLVKTKRLNIILLLATTINKVYTITLVLLIYNIYHL